MPAPEYSRKYARSGKLVVVDSDGVEWGMILPVGLVEPVAEAIVERMPGSDLVSLSLQERKVTPYTRWVTTVEWQSENGSVKKILPD